MSDPVLRLLLAADALLYLSALVLNLGAVSKKVGSVLPERVAYLTAVCLNVFLIGRNYFVNQRANGSGYAPFVSMFQVLIFLAFCFCPVWLFFEKVCRQKGFKPCFLLASAVVMTGPCFMDIGDVWTFPPALQSVFFIPHIVCYMFSYTLAAVAFLIVILSVIKKESFDGACVCCVRILYPFMTAGLFLGAVWADQVWGEFWAWDIKECWALVTWLVYTLCLHLFHREKLKKAARWLIAVGFVLVIVTFLFSNVLNVASNHSY